MPQTRVVISRSTMASKSSRRRTYLDAVAERPLPESAFPFAIVRIAVAQICQSVGFKTAQHGALEIITDLAIRYLQATAKLAASSACFSGRAQSNLFDIIVALEDLASVQGFPGLSNARAPSLLGSVVIKDLMMFVKYRDEVPFAQPLPSSQHLESARNKLLNRCNLEGQDGILYCNRSSWRHVPRWLPEVPVVEKQKVDDRKTEGRWGCLDEKDEKTWVCHRQETAKRRLGDDIEMPGKRETVRFKMGLDFRLSKNGCKKHRPFFAASEEAQGACYDK